MKKLFTKIFLLLLAVFTTLFALERGYDYLLSFNRNMKSEYVGLGSINADIVIHGPCEPEWMLDPKIMEPYVNKSIYNLALNHSDFADNLLLLHLYITHNKPPESIFLYVTPESFDTRANTFNTYRYAPFLDDPLIAETIKEVDPAYYRWTWIPFMRYGYYGNFTNFKAVQGFKHLATKRELPYHPKGYTPVGNPRWNNHIEGFNDIYRKNHVFKWEPLREKYFRKTIEYCKAKNIPLYLYESPILNATLPYQINREEFMARIGDIAKEYALPLYVFDDLPMADSTANFISTLNTSLLGSEKFSRYFGEFLRDGGF